MKTAFSALNLTPLLLAVMLPSFSEGKLASKQTVPDLLNQFEKPTDRSLFGKEAELIDITVIDDQKNFFEDPDAQTFAGVAPFYVGNDLVNEAGIYDESGVFYDSDSCVFSIVFEFDDAEKSQIAVTSTCNGFVGPIVGGTGAYACARGAMKDVEFNGDGDKTATLEVYTGC